MPLCELKLWDLSSGKELAVLEGPKGGVESLAFSHDGKCLVSGGGNTYAKLGEVFLWDAGKRRKIASHVNHANLVLSVAFSPKGNLIASGSADKTVRIWDINQLTRP